ncbi:MAG TPA: ASKHA domain-containing protein [Patescibacteria group bacterium]|nr:ASKHA domain-containing protein [Patescibacteria group bacterium]
MAVSLVILTDPGDARTRRELTVAAGTSILKAAHDGGVDVTATCGGRGRCTSCRVKFVAGTIPPPTIMDEIQLGDDLVREGYRLSCQCAVTEPVTVQVAPPLEEHSFQILGAGPGVGGLGVRIDAGIAKELVKVSLPREEHHQTSDLEQLAAAVGVAPESVGLSVMAGLPQALRDDPAGVTVTTFTSGSAGAGRTVVAVERGDTTAMKFGLAIDVGTTSVVTTLLELESGEQLATVSSLNPQAVFGGDLMSRIAFAQFNPINLRKLHTRIVGLLNQHVAEVCRASGVLPKWIYKAVVVGNTCMHHLLLGIDPSHVGLAPYAPVMRHAAVLPARELLLKLAPEARVCLLPLVAGFVGADAVAVALATRLADSPALRVAVDIGTNGEVLLGSRERLLACSAPAGPALEGAQIRHGMRGAQGAIDRVTIGDDVRVHTIGETPALGICGSGLIDLLAGLLEAGVIDWTGLIRVEARDSLPPALRDRVAMRGEERVFTVLRPGEAGARAEIVLTQDDVRQVQLAKGAIASGITMLLHVAAVPLERVEELMLAGGFGNYLSIASAIRIGLIPRLPLSRVRYVGNAASLGAQLCLLSEAERARADAIASRIEHVSLAAHPDFEQIFVDAMNFPRD